MGEWVPDPEERRNVVQLMEMRLAGRDVFFPRTLKELAARATMQLPGMMTRGKEKEMRAFWNQHLPQELVDLVVSAPLRKPLDKDFPRFSDDLFAHIYPNFRRIIFHIAFAFPNDVRSELREHTGELVRRDTAFYRVKDDGYLAENGDGYQMILRVLINDPSPTMRFLAGEILGVMSSWYSTEWFAKFPQQVIAWHDGKNDISQHGAMCAFEGVMDMFEELPVEGWRALHEGGSLPELIQRSIGHLSSSSNVHTQSACFMAIARMVEYHWDNARNTGVGDVFRRTLTTFVTEERVATTHGFLCLMKAFMMSDYAWISATVKAQMGCALADTLNRENLDFYAMVEAINCIVLACQEEIRLFDKAFYKLLTALFKLLMFTPAEMEAQHIGPTIDHPGYAGHVLNKDGEWTRRKGVLASIEGLAAMYGGETLPIIMAQSQPLINSLNTREHEAGVIGFAAAATSQAEQLWAVRPVLWPLVCNDQRKPQACVRSAAYFLVQQMEMLDEYDGDIKMLTLQQERPFMYEFFRILASEDLVCNDERVRWTAADLLAVVTGDCRELAASGVAQMVMASIVKGIKEELFQPNEYSDIFTLVDNIVTNEVNGETTERLILMCLRETRAISKDVWVEQLRVVAGCVVAVLGEVEDEINIRSMPLYAAMTLLLELVEVSRALELPAPVVSHLERVVARLHELLGYALTTIGAVQEDIEQMVIRGGDDPVTLLDFLMAGYGIIAGLYSHAMIKGHDDTPVGTQTEEYYYLNNHALPISVLVSSIHNDLMPTVLVSYPDEPYIEMFWAAFADAYSSMRRNRDGKIMPMPAVADFRSYHVAVMTRIGYAMPTNNGHWCLVEMLRLRDLDLTWEEVEPTVKRVTQDMIVAVRDGGGRMSWANAGTFISLTHLRFPEHGFLMGEGAPLLPIIFKHLRQPPATDGDREDQDDTMRGVLSEFLRVAATSNSLPVSFEDGMGLIQLLSIKRKEHFTPPTIALIHATLEVARTRVPVEHVRVAISQADARYTDGFVPDQKHEAQIDALLEAEAAAAAADAEAGGTEEGSEAGEGEDGNDEEEDEDEDDGDEDEAEEEITDEDE